MVSFTFLLCTVFLCGAIAAPYPGDDDAAAPASAVATVEINQTLAEEITQQASQAGVKVLTDLLDGKDLQTSLLDRSIEAFGKVRGEVASIGHSFLKRLRELKNGVGIEKVAGNIWKSVQRKFAGKSKNFDDIIEAIGIDNVTKFVESATKVIKETITEMIKKRKEAKEAKELEVKALKENPAEDKEAQAILDGLAKEVKAKAAKAA